MRELLITGGTLIAMDAARTVAPKDVLVRDDRIAWIGAHGDAPVAAPGVQRTQLSADNAVVLPGFVQAHVHLCQVLFRGLADDLPLLAWLRERIWPLEASHDEHSLRTSAELGIAELLLGGTTTILDMGTTRNHDVVFAALEQSGMRATSGKAMMDRGEGAPSALLESTRESLDESDRLRAHWHGRAEGRLRYAYAPRFILSCSSELLHAVGARRREPGGLVHTHVAEHKEERIEVERLLGRSDIDALAEHGICGPQVVMAHAVQLTKREMKQAAKLGTRFVHCPSANLKLASGIADVVELRKAGLVVGLGCDGAPCNNRLDALSELRLALLLSKVKRGDAQALAPLEALAMATIDGARALGLDEEVGSIECGKRADLVVVSLDGVHQAPLVAPLSALCYASSASDVRHVVVDGVVRVRERELLGVDLAELTARARVEAMACAKRAGL
ncbi:MAG: S-adenosylhomocysteine deaminase [Myxococcaceae bacterium]|nr:S-adenosylhomocysteine deaminase [Myxococcaceae bacterium]